MEAGKGWTCWRDELEKVLRRRDIVNRLPEVWHRARDGRFTDAAVCQLPRPL